MKKFHATILIVEDDPNDQIFIERAFRGIGVTDPIRVVDDGEEAISYMMGKGKYSDRQAFAYPTFIITDLKMPRADGFAVLEFLKSNPQWAVIPTVVFSSSQDLDDIKKSYMLGASSYHVKPQTSEQLNKLISVLHAYWSMCEVPEVDSTGKQLLTDSEGKLGERFAQSGAERGSIAPSPKPVPPPLTSPEFRSPFMFRRRLMKLLPVLAWPIVAKI